MTAPTPGVIYNAFVYNGSAPPSAPVLNQRMMMALNQAFTRAFLAGRGSSSVDPDPRRKIARECGWPETPTPDLYDYLYLRNPMARRVVEVGPEQSWRRQPTVYEKEKNTVKTAFEQAWKALPLMLRGELSRFKSEEGSPVFAAMRRADIVAGVNCYSIILLGFDDTAALDRPIAGLVEAGARPAKRGEQPAGDLVPYKFSVNAAKTTGRKLLYLRVFPESLAPVAEYETNWSSPRFNQPVYYNVTVGDPSTVGGKPLKVHWTRVIHVPGDPDSEGSRLQPVLDTVLDGRKLYGAFPEMYWKGAFPGLSLETDPALGGDVLFDEAKLKDQVERWENGLSRVMAWNGFSANMLSPTVVDPTAQIDKIIEAVCIAIKCPVRIFKGSERGELASSQDERDWVEKMKGRQGFHNTPNIVAPFVDRLIMAGVLPPVDEFFVDWPDLATKSDKEKADLAVTKTTALDTYTKGAASSVIAPMDYLTRVMDFTEEEAEAILEAATEYTDEQQAEQQRADLEAAALQQEQGMLAEGANGQANGAPVGGQV